MASPTKTKVAFTARELLDGKWMLSQWRADDEGVIKDFDLMKFDTLDLAKAAIKRIIEKKSVNFNQYGEEVK